MQVVRSATLSRLYRMLGDFHMSPYTLVQKILKVFRFLPLFHWHEICLRNHTSGVVKGAKQLLSFQLGFEHCQHVSLN